MFGAAHRAVQLVGGPALWAKWAQFHFLAPSHPRCTANFPAPRAACLTQEHALRTSAAPGPPCDIIECTRVPLSVSLFLSDLDISAPSLNDQPPLALCCGPPLQRYSHPSHLARVHRMSYHEREAVPIMPAPTQPRPGFAQLSTKRRRIGQIRVPNLSPVHPQPPNAPLLRRRAPALERLPAWLSALRRDFIAAGPSFPVPARIADCGNPFYDWDAWALKLLDPVFWRRRGLWHRLIACCTAARPASVRIEQVADIKCALVRIVIAEVVAKLVAREGDALTPEDRNWITSVASRQRGRRARKPTLILLFDLAFAVFDFAKFCATSTSVKAADSEQPAHLIELSEEKVLNATTSQKQHSIEVAIERIVSDTLPVQPCDQEESKLSSSLPVKSQRKDSAAPGPNLSPFKTRRFSIESIVLSVLDIVHSPCQGELETSRIDNVNKVIQVIEMKLTSSRANRWYQQRDTSVDAAEEGLMQATVLFARNLPLHGANMISREGAMSQFQEWLLESLRGDNWCVWADLANDCDYIMTCSGLPEHKVHEFVCRNIATRLFSESTVVPASFVEGQATAHVTGLSLRGVFDVAMAMERFFSFFVETYGTTTTSRDRTKWGVLCFEGIVQFLAKLREPLTVVPNWTEAMVEWSVRSLQISSYYREALLIDEKETSRKGKDMERAIRIAFSEASWPAKIRSSRLMVQTNDESMVNLKSKEQSTTSSLAPFWMVQLDLNESINLAAAIVPWDPCRALKLVDEAIGLTEEELQWVRSGRGHLPLWDYRRIAICRNLLKRQSLAVAKLMMERLQILFAQSEFHVGGNFSEHAAEILQRDVKNGNFCAQTSLGLLHAGHGEYWKLARSSAKCERSLSYGIELLFTAAVSGDLEACTAVAHILAECRDSEGKVKGVSPEQVYTLVRTAHATQNADAMMNAGVVFRYGLPELAPSAMVARDAFLIALQGGHSEDTKCIAARHLAETARREEGKLVVALSQLISEGKSHRKKGDVEQ